METIKLNIIADKDWLEATWTKEVVTQIEGKEDRVETTQVWCESYSGHPEHIAMLRAKALEFGTELDEALITECVANFKYPTEEELAQQELKAKIAEAKAYLASTDWVEPYLIKHYTGLEALEADSNKFAIEAKRSEARAFLKEQGL